MVKCEECDKKLGFEQKAYPKRKSEYYQRADTYMVLEF